MVVNQGHRTKHFGIRRFPALLDKLTKEGTKDGGHGAIALPYLDEVVEDLPALSKLSNYIMVAV